MQFKHPEYLYFLALLIIPILVHLFQLRRFKKVPFTNVAFLQKIIIENRKSSQIKKWLILCTRLLLLAAIILAFAQPFFSNHAIEEQQNTFIYLDNSLSTGAVGKKGELLQIASQELIETASDKENYSLLTNSNFYQNISVADLKSALLKTNPVATTISTNDIFLKIANHKKRFNSLNTKSILISDFQNIDKALLTKRKESLALVKLEAEQKHNISIDSVFIDETSSNNMTLSILIKNQGVSKDNVPIAIYDNQQLLSKQTFSVNENTDIIINFNLLKKPSLLGKIEINLDDAFDFDNTFYFAITANEKINVLAVGNDNGFITRLFSGDEFKLTSSTLKNVNFNSIDKQQVIILNELETIPESLQTALLSFSEKGGNLVIIPNEKADLKSYNLFFKHINIGKISPIQKDTLKITNINFSHPLFKNVFNKKTNNFQYPFVQYHFPSSFNYSNTIISFENSKGFIKQVPLKHSNLFWVSAPLNKTNSNFTNSPLIVPIFYNIGQHSLQLSELFYRINKRNIIDINYQLGKNDVIKIKNQHSSFIPLQQTFQNKVSVITENQPNEADFYIATRENDTLRSIAFNQPKSESSLQFLNVADVIKDYDNISVSNSVKNTIQKIQDKNKVQWLWKWFLALAIVSLLLEILILKYVKA